MLRFCPGTDSLALSVRHTPGSSPQDSIMVLRERLEDFSVSKMVRINHRGCLLKDLGKKMQKTVPMPVCA